MRNILAHLLVLSTVTGSLPGADLNVRHVSAMSGVEAKNGMFFALPRTVITVATTMELSEFKPGSLAMLSGLFFPENYPKKPLTLTEYQEKFTKEHRAVKFKDAALGTKGEPDPEYVFWIDLKSKAFLERNVTLSMTEAGAVTSLSASADNTFPDFLMSLLSTATGIAARAMVMGPATVVACTGAGGSKEAFILDQLSGADKRLPGLVSLFKAGNDEVYQAQMTEAAKDIACPGPAAGFAVKPNSDLAQAIAARRAYVELEDNRKKLLSEKLAASGVEVTALVAMIEAEKKALIANFYGTTGTTEWATSFEYRISSTSATKENAFFFPIAVNAEGDKICLDTDNWRGSKMPGKDFLLNPADPNCAMPGPSEHKKLVLHAKARAGALDAMGGHVTAYDTSRAEQGMPYRIPRLADVKVTFGGEGGILARQEMALAQAGIVASLPKSLGSKKTKATLTYYDSTGALKSLDSSGTPISGKAVADAASGSVNALMDAQAKADLAARTAADPLTKLQRQRALLEEKVKIAAACATLKIDPCPLEAQ